MPCGGALHSAARALAMWCHPQEAQAAALAGEVTQLRCAEARLAAEIASLQAAAAAAARERDGAKRALAEARDAEAERLVLEVYPLMRAATILGIAAGGKPEGWLGAGWARGGGWGRGRPGARPQQRARLAASAACWWPGRAAAAAPDACAATLTPAATGGGPLVALKTPDRMNGDERRAAAAAAAEWEAERLRTRALLSRLADRAEAAELALAEARAAAGGGAAQAGSLVVAGGGGSSLARRSSGGGALVVRRCGGSSGGAQCAIDASERATLMEAELATARWVPPRGFARDLSVSKGWVGQLRAVPL